MTIEIGKGLTHTQTSNPGEETQTGAVQQHADESEQATGKPVDTVEITDRAQRLQQLHNSISNLPVVDTQRVEDMRMKIKNGELDILGNGTSLDESAQRIADKLLQNG